jgi:hypothetical protein
MKGVDGTGETSLKLDKLAPLHDCPRSGVDFVRGLFQIRNVACE